MFKKSYERGDIILVADPKMTDAKPYPCVVIRQTVDKNGVDTVVALRTNNPNFIKNYEEAISEDFYICGRQRAFILSSLLYVPVREILGFKGNLKASDMERFNRMLLKNYGLDTVGDNTYREKYDALVDGIRALID